MRDLISGISALHQKDILHLDIKPEVCKYIFVYVYVVAHDEIYLYAHWSEVYVCTAL